MSLRSGRVYGSSNLLGAGASEGKCEEGAESPPVPYTCTTCVCWHAMYKCGAMAPETDFQWDFCQNRTDAQILDGEPCDMYDEYISGEDDPVPREIDVCCCDRKLHGHDELDHCSCLVKVFSDKAACAEILARRAVGLEHLSTVDYEVARGSIRPTLEEAAEERAFLIEARDFKDDVECYIETHGDCRIWTVPRARWDTIYQIDNQTGQKVATLWRCWSRNEGHYVGDDWVPVPETHYSRRLRDQTVVHPRLLSFSTASDIALRSESVP